MKFVLCLLALVQAVNIDKLPAEAGTLTKSELPGDILLQQRLKPILIPKNGQAVVSNDVFDMKEFHKYLRAEAQSFSPIVDEDNEWKYVFEQRQPFSPNIPAAEEEELEALNRPRNAIARIEIQQPTDPKKDWSTEQHELVQKYLKSQEGVEVKPLTAKDIHIIQEYVLSRKGEQLGWGEIHVLPNGIAVQKIRNNDYSRNPPVSKGGKVVARPYRNHDWNVIGRYVPSQKHALYTAVGIMNSKPAIADKQIVRFNYGDTLKGGAIRSTLNLEIFHKSNLAAEEVDAFANRDHMKDANGNPKPVHHNIHVEYQNGGQTKLLHYRFSGVKDQRGFVVKGPKFYHLPGAPGNEYHIQSNKQVVISRRPIPII